MAFIFLVAVSSNWLIQLGPWWLIQLGSNTEANNTSYFANDAARIANYDGSSWCWTLRSAYNAGNVYCVGNNNGTTGGFIDYNSNNNGLRPAFWVSL